MSRTVRIDPLLVLIAVLVGASLGDWISGLFGGFVAALIASPPWARSDNRPRYLAGHRRRQPSRVQPAQPRRARSARSSQNSEVGPASRRDVPTGPGRRRRAGCHAGRPTSVGWPVARGGARWCEHVAMADGCCLTVSWADEIETQSAKVFLLAPRPRPPRSACDCWEPFLADPLVDDVGAARPSLIGKKLHVPVPLRMT